MKNSTVGFAISGTPLGATLIQDAWKSVSSPPKPRDHRHVIQLDSIKNILPPRNQLTANNKKNTTAVFYHASHHLPCAHFATSRAIQMVWQLPPSTTSSGAAPRIPHAATELLTSPG
jgi:hypothetical protein